MVLLRAGIDCGAAVKVHVAATSREPGPEVREVPFTAGREMPEMADVCSLFRDCVDAPMQTTEDIATW